MYTGLLALAGGEGTAPILAAPAKVYLKSQVNAENGFSIPITNRLVIVWPPPDIGHQGATFAVDSEIEFHFVPAFDIVLVIYYPEIQGFNIETDTLETQEQIMQICIQCEIITMVFLPRIAAGREKTGQQKVIQLVSPIYAGITGVGLMVTVFG